MHRTQRLLPLIAGSAMLVGLSTIASAQSYTMTFEDLLPNSTAPYDSANLVPANYAPPELAGSGITVTFAAISAESVVTSPAVFYGDPISPTNDHTSYGPGADIYTIGTVQLTFSQPVYMTSAWVTAYHYPAQSNDAAAIAVARQISVAGFTNISDTTPVITAVVAGANHVEAWRGGSDEFKWRDVIALGATPITKLTFDAVGFPQIDDITISTTPVTPLFGDFNRNGIVDDGDYTIWADTYDTWTNPENIGLPYDVFGTINHGVDLRADANGNGYIDDGDYTIWADTYGQGSAPLTVDITPVPEPASLGLLALGGLAVLARRRK